MSLDFTQEKYAQFCEALNRLDCPVMTIRQFLEAGQPQRFVVVLRHDVDRALPLAISLAKMEADYNLHATYYVRTTRAVFRADSIRYLSRLGHEVGYHYEVLAKAQGNTQKAAILFAQELEQFRRIVSVETISMHGSPLMPWNNLDLWQTYDLKDYNLLGEAYLSIDYSNVYYFTDTGRSWDSDRYNIRDRVASRTPPQRIHTTDDLMSFLAKIPDCPVFINVHPNRWPQGGLAWFVSAASDWSINQIKWGVSLARKRYN